MSAEVAVRGAVVAALRGDAVLMAGVNGLFDGAPGRASAPYGVVGDCIALDWGAKDVEGRELTVAVSLFDVGEAPARLGGLLERVDAAMRALGPVEGWRVVGARLVRSRVTRTAARDGWQALADYRVRVVRA
ncbi:MULTISPECIES: DUF3168 domain-containing protein [Sphingobium]|jgi:hypothetical protein|uniref:DUF3168 domain-containing protein n=1 Tax=Sphingobium fuliginis (strain ATCC 27551) TaxID=336203 RepID=A0A292ZDC7_SPHSA|nr:MULTISPECIES: DUF3168 domain-containing protein [Sphingobium]QOT73017.1 DUF3168 domain-containing protein [Sphingobium fuliginis]GAY20901.1 hypothetical protein SFOMI_1431 [Sphingobium fuliginis]